MLITELEKAVCNGNLALAEIFAGFCVLSDAQELADRRVVKQINHAKRHIMEGMMEMGFGITSKNVKITTLDEKAEDEDKED